MGDADDDDELDLEASIKAEVAGIKKPTQEPLFIPIKLDVQCGKSHLNSHFFHAQWAVHSISCSVQPRLI